MGLGCNKSEACYVHRLGVVDEVARGELPRHRHGSVELAQPLTGLLNRGDSSAGPATVAARSSCIGPGHFHLSPLRTRICPSQMELLAGQFSRKRRESGASSLSKLQAGCLKPLRFRGLHGLARAMLVGRYRRLLGRKVRAQPEHAGAAYELTGAN